MSSSSRSDLSLFRRLLFQARPYWLRIVGLLLLSLLATPLALLMPLPLKIAVDSIIDDLPLPGFVAAVLPQAVQESTAIMLVLMAALLILINLLNYLHQLAVSLFSTYIGERVMVSFRAQLFAQSQRLSLAFHDAKGTSHSTYRILYDAPAIRDITVHSLIPFVTAGVTLIGMIYVTALINGQLAILALAISPVLMFLHQVSRKRLRRQWDQVESHETSALSVVNEALGALRVVKAFGQEQREGERFLRYCNQSTQARVRFAVIERSLALLMGMATAVGLALVLYVGVNQVQAGAITVGELLVVMSYVAQLYEPMKAITGVAANLQSQLARTGRAFDLLDEPSDVPERPNACALRGGSGAIRFENVSFAYDDNAPVLRDISFDIEPGTRVGIVGPTGAGKSTLVSLLPRFYDPTEGRICFDGVDVREFKLADLRNQFAIVLQEPVLFSTSIGENIAYARPEAGYDEIVAAAKAADVHQFIAGLPEEYDTLVGERGMRLSGGERQRLALARAFLKDTPVAILDEPTSSIDLATEQEILRAMERLMEGRTVFMIAHRLSTLRTCDILIQLQEGQYTIHRDVQAKIDNWLDEIA